MIPVCEPLLAEQDMELVLDCLRTGWISSAGRYLDEFEAGWAAYCGMPHGVAVSNGTTALEVAVALLDLQPGDEVIMPTFTIISCAQAIVTRRRRGRSWWTAIRAPGKWMSRRWPARSRRAPAPSWSLHIYGHPADMDPLLDLAGRHNLMVIEDAAEAHGAEYRGRKCGGMSDISTFSFYANKIITTGEGGMVLTQRDDLAERARSLRNLCFQRRRRFLHDELGYNFRLTNLQAALGVAQLGRIERIVERKRAIAHAYTERLQDLPGLALPVEEPWARNVYWVYGIVLDETTGMDAAVLARRLHERGVDTRPFFLGMHEQPVFHRHGAVPRRTLPGGRATGRPGIVSAERADDSRYRDRSGVRCCARMPEIVSRNWELPTSTDTNFARAYADAYDTMYHDKDYAAECDFLADVFSRFAVGPIHSIIDLGCGTGSHAIPLARRGYEVFGVDRSAQMIAIASMKARRGRIPGRPVFRSGRHPAGGPGTHVRRGDLHVRCAGLPDDQRRLSSMACARPAAMLHRMGYSYAISGMVRRCSPSDQATGSRSSPTAATG